ncbi:protein PHOTOSYSTEM I ASSEMBLY 2, chloroplastic-like isoform X2 [Cucurbita pepo subsp. pepo]|uniref:protein PHOTOSYSTEM I ASSEMBLY 2, chloroplastic-like n=1 Tax=Cucurbita pepo subsp. pepo TaxID=3664 RepID=UPI000C9D46B9|nr:protein PHOTOSYSTEM I ASSEMBLY 2, chloroplastic-like [Cucurbita pepo subsp. pepo]XP_023553311.1 protein PHOTOSYSTEM I ASSEMBLY 2, chloroplastic-like isoform X1 [Cucurbita pepo subsp. pepo]XP_023553319.1 protein PHOTOSYSTEM I ASSEMBLY 2, chloroplastic-like isoform X2 [Cucurbita pepo subsp. pepo]
MAWCGSSVSKSNNSTFPFPFPPHGFAILPQNKSRSKPSNIPFAAAPKFSLPKRCQTCGGKGAIDCPGCKGTGRNKKNGNIFERWKCFECQGFGLKSCPDCGKGGLTPEQRGER